MSLNNNNLKIEKENSRNNTNNETIVYKIVNYMTSLIGGFNDNMARNNPCIGILTPMSPIMITDHTHSTGDTMVLPSPEPMIQLIPNSDPNNNLFLRINSNEKFLNKFGPKITPFVNLNNGLFFNEQDDYMINGNISYINSPDNVCSNFSKKNTINQNLFIPKINDSNFNYKIIKSPVNNHIYHANNSLNNSSITEIIVSPELAQTLQKIISIITDHLEKENSENLNNNYNNQYEYIKLNRFERINKNNPIGGLNYALMSYSASVIQKHYREFDNNRLVRFVNTKTRSKYTKDQIIQAINIIQRNWRVYLYRNQLMKEYLVKSVIIARNTASCKIASCWKGYKTRKYFDSVIKDVVIKWIWNNDFHENKNEDENEIKDNSKNKRDHFNNLEHKEDDVRLRGSFTCKPWQEQLKLTWNEKLNCFLINICLSKGVHYLQFIINDEIKACGSMEIVVLPIIGVSNKINIINDDYHESTRKFIINKLIFI